MLKNNFLSRVSLYQLLRGGAWQAIDLYKRMSQASKKGGMFDDVMRHAKAWADKQVTQAEVTKKKRSTRSNQNSLL
jgi:hypothetical protein